jgi:hypothetical protein
MLAKLPKVKITVHEGADLKAKSFVRISILPLLASLFLARFLDYHRGWKLCHCVHSRYYEERVQQLE